jgi:hypothetical protein
MAIIWNNFYVFIILESMKVDSNNYIFNIDKNSYILMAIIWNNYYDSHDHFVVTAFFNGYGSSMMTCLVQPIREVKPKN